MLNVSPSLCTTEGGDAVRPQTLRAAMKKYPSSTHTKAVFPLHDHLQKEGFLMGYSQETSLKALKRQSGDTHIELKAKLIVQNALWGAGH